MFNLKKNISWVFILPLLVIGCNKQSEVTPIITSHSITHPDWSYNSTIYEINIRQYSKEGTFKGLEKDLPRLKDLGVEILWLMPIHPIGEINRKGSLGSYYSVRDYFDVNPEYGTKQDFKDLVNTAHSLNMKIILDWIANHTAWDNPIASTNPDFFEKNEAGEFIPPRGTDWDDVIQLDYENKEVWTFMKSALRYWVEEFDIDGYRCDVAYLVPTEFWNEVRAELDSIKPVFMLAEAESPDHHIAAFDMSYGWKMHHLFNEIAQGNETPDKIDEYVQENRNNFPEGSFRMQFTSNHDENSWNGTEFERLGPAVKTFAVLAHTMEGMPLIYNGQEMGMDKRLEFFEKDPIPWQENEFFEFYSKLNHLKSTNSALLNGEKGAQMQRVDADHPDIYAFIRDSGDDKVLVLLNLGNDVINQNIKSELIKGDYQDLFTDENISLNVETTIELEPWGYKVYYY